MRSVWAALSMGCIIIAVGDSATAEMPLAAPEQAEAAPILLPVALSADDQFWSDEFVFRRWRIQRSAYGMQHRLLDPSNGCQAFGTWDACRNAFAEVKRREMLPPLSGRDVITLHGLIRLRQHMDGMGSYLAEQGGYHWVNVSYASTRRTIDEHAQSLAHVIEGLDGIEEINFVGHSLGNLVVRRYLGEAQRPAPQWKPDGRIKRMVMLGPPNQGAHFAELFKSNVLFGLIMGPSGKQLGRAWKDTEPLLATPTFPFGIIAGGTGNGRSLNPLLKGDNDLVVSVAETRLAGASDFRVLHCMHGEFMDDELARKCVHTFLEHGYFSSEAERQPIAAAAPQTDVASQ